MAELRKLLQDRDTLESTLRRMCRDNGLLMRSGDTASHMKDSFFRAIGKAQSDQVRNIANEIRGKGQPFYILERKEGVFRRSPMVIVFDPLCEYPQQNHVASVNSYVFNFRESTTQLAKSLRKIIAEGTGKSVEVRDIVTREFQDVDASEIVVRPPETEKWAQESAAEAQEAVA